MVYRRRYFEPFVGTTETIGDKSITGDKVDEGAISTGKIADDAVTSEKIADGEVKSADIGAGQVKTSDLASGAVTTEKIADAAVTTPKIADTVALRPLTPAATTSEIGDQAITQAKLAPDSVDATKIKPGAVGASELAGDAVETVKIKDAAVTGAKIDTDTITDANLAADSVGGPEIKDGAIESPQLSADAVETVDIKDGAVTPPKLGAVDTPADGEVPAYDLATGKFEWVPQPTPITKHTDLTDKEVAGVIDHADKSVTEPKLEDDFLRKYLEGRQVFYDDFLGAVLDNRWAQSGDAGGSVVMFPRSKAHINTAIATNSLYRINWNGALGIYVGKLPKFYTRFWASNFIESDLAVFVGLRKDANNLIWFSYDPGVSANWRAHCISAGVPTVVDTGVPFAYGEHDYYIDVVSAGEVKFWIGGVLKATINTNIPATVDVEPWLEIKTLEATLPATIAVDKVLISADPDHA